MPGVNGKLEMSRRTAQVRMGRAVDLAWMLEPPMAAQEVIARESSPAVAYIRLLTSVYWDQSTLEQ
ncbi:hypothetical protein O9K51_08776 [Purpureocillium lavendulum]|uniref:Uncharacterized protein n=1 Tax=Purpureocillium lavendulum TaxID=1247861 RepID=A0AB34FGY8_9HYPO|nr:hypothetical protein O9K51_08776 [Purpureocillium lavendulum]